MRAALLLILGPGARGLHRGGPCARQWRRRRAAGRPDDQPRLCRSRLRARSRSPARTTSSSRSAAAAVGPRRGRPASCSSGSRSRSRTASSGSAARSATAGSASARITAAASPSTSPCRRWPPRRSPARATCDRQGRGRRVRRRDRRLGRHRDRQRSRVGAADFSIAGSGGVTATGSAESSRSRSPARATSTPAGLQAKTRQDLGRRLGQCRAPMRARAPMSSIMGSGDVDDDRRRPSARSTRWARATCAAAEPDQSAKLLTVNHFGHGPGHEEAPASPWPPSPPRPVASRRPPPPSAASWSPISTGCRSTDPIRSTLVTGVRPRRSRTGPPAALDRVSIDVQGRPCASGRTAPPGAAIRGEAARADRDPDLDPRPSRRDGLRRRQPRHRKGEGSQDRPVPVGQRPAGRGRRRCRSARNHSHRLGQDHACRQGKAAPSVDPGQRRSRRRWASSRRCRYRRRHGGHDRPHRGAHRQGPRQRQRRGRDRRCAGLHGHRARLPATSAAARAQ